MDSDDDELWRCDSCNRRFPPPELKRVAYWVETSRTSGRYRSGNSSGSSNRISRGGFSHGNSSRMSSGYTSGTVTKRRQVSLFCVDCIEEKRLISARQRRNILIFGAIIALGIIAFTVLSIIRDSPDSPASADTQSNGAAVTQETSTSIKDISGGAPASAPENDIQTVPVQNGKVVESDTTPPF